MKVYFANKISAAIFWVLLVGCIPAIAQPKQAAQPVLSEDEQKLAAAINAAPDLAAKLNAAGDLIKKYPKTSLRSQVVENMASQVANVTDNAQKLALAQQLLTIFNEPAEVDIVGPVAVQAYADTNQADGAFAKGAELLARAPDAVTLLVQLVAIGSDQVKKQNGKFVTQSIQHANQAISLIEANKKPARVDEARWTAYKAQTLPALYQSTGLLNFANGNRSEAKASYTKASQLNPSDAFNFIMLGAMLNEEYQTEAKQYQAMPPGPARDAQLTKVQGLLDSVIDAYAHGVALSEGNAALQSIRAQYLQDLESYFKYRHSGSTDGMQALIDKYKAPAKP